MPSNSSLRVSGSLSLKHGGGPFGEPIDAWVAVERDSGGELYVSVMLDTGTEWLLALDPANAAYLAGSLAMEAGVILG